ncbi:MAG: hypothetical protein JST04_02885 [Bdellovibrionales bacterium]|nr:hypothetical protein [Bdellovibrionales bacterium]
MMAEKSVVGSDIAEYAEKALAWIHENPREAAVLSALGGFAIGLTGVGRIYRGVKALRTMPLVSQMVLGAVAKGVLSGAASRAETPVMH